MNRQDHRIVNKSTILGGIVPALSAIILLASCGSHPRIDPEGPFWVDDDRRNIDEPEFREPDLSWTTIDRTVFDPGLELLDLERSARILTGHRKRAVNINSFDEVPNSSWFTNRHGFERMSTEQIRTGPARTAGPDTTGVWTVFRPKVGGQTPGFWIEDARGDQYIIKFDPHGFPQLGTGAAAVVSRYFHACGYNVAQETIVYWRPEMLRIKEGATIKNAAGKKRPFLQEDLDEILAEVHHEPDGRIRSLASLSLGNVKGPFSYSGRRKDDPNDWCRHEDRRELRGLYVIGSLVNHYDLKDHNSLDVFEEENGRGFLRHYLLDFGSTLGADGHGAKPPIKGYANFFDLRDNFVSLVTLGLKTWPWEYAKPYQYPSIGYFESKLFEPDKFDPIYPNPAFENMTDRDAYWGAKIVMAFTDEDLKALVSTGQYSDPEAEAYLLRTLLERRDKIGRHWFNKINPLDYFEVGYFRRDLQFRFEDLAVKYGLYPDNATYFMTVRYRGENVIGPREFRVTSFALSLKDQRTMMAQFPHEEGSDEQEDHLYEIILQTKRQQTGLSKPTRLLLWFDDLSERFRLVSIEHMD
ncbi:MAG: hypothetical protein OEV49_06720 [candidate division Zixibacteria bacterium]|nr:hypothetical protein [candidate division Zixibacteria bacterium]MDH3938803.1 hypothetical protein [candidate division Zixibacteria bacterium]